MVELNDRPVLSLREKVKIIGPNGEKEDFARIDTGAHTSSIDVRMAAQLNLGPIVSTKTVKSASGVGLRPIIKAKIILHGIEIESDFTIANRDHMKYSVLIGRNILRTNKFLVDPHEGADDDKE